MWPLFSWLPFCSCVADSPIPFIFHFCRYALFYGDFVYFAFRPAEINHVSGGDLMRLQIKIKNLIKKNYLYRCCNDCKHFFLTKDCITLNLNFNTLNWFKNFTTYGTCNKVKYIEKTLWILKLGVKRESFRHATLSLKIMIPEKIAKNRAEKPTMKTFKWYAPFGLLLSLDIGGQTLIWIGYQVSGIDLHNNQIICQVLELEGLLTGFLNWFSIAVRKRSLIKINRNQLTRKSICAKARF